MNPVVLQVFSNSCCRDGACPVSARRAQNSVGPSRGKPRLYDKVLAAAVLVKAR
jgi:hypothetical protein